MILLKGPNEINQTTGQWFGLAREKLRSMEMAVDEYQSKTDYFTPAAKQANLDFSEKSNTDRQHITAVHQIDVEQWAKMNDSVKLAHLYDMLKVG